MVRSAERSCIARRILLPNSDRQGSAWRTRQRSPAFHQASLRQQPRYQAVCVCENQPEVVSIQLAPALTCKKNAKVSRVTVPLTPSIEIAALPSGDEPARTK